MKFLIKLIKLIKYCVLLSVQAFCANLSYLRILIGAKIIVIDGGHGSQIIKYAIFAKYKELNGKIHLDNSYFHSSMISENNYIKRPWTLDKYGIELAQHSVVPFYTRISDERFINIFEGTIQKAFMDPEWLNATFPLPKGIEIELENLGVSVETLNIGVGIHIRQGDYVDVASKYLKDNDYAAILEKVLGTMRFLENRIVIIFSDSDVNALLFPKVFSIINKFNFNFIVLDKVDPWISHCAMRFVNVLICANSTFSFSAALLRQGISIFPKEFYSDSSKPLNQIILNSANYLIRI